MSSGAHTVTARSCGRGTALEDGVGCAQALQQVQAGKALHHRAIVNMMVLQILVMCIPDEAARWLDLPRFTCLTVLRLRWCQAGTAAAAELVQTTLCPHMLCGHSNGCMVQSSGCGQGGCW